MKPKTMTPSEAWVSGMIPGQPKWVVETIAAEFDLTEQRLADLWARRLSLLIPDWRAFNYHNLPEDGPYWFILGRPEYDETGPLAMEERRILLGSLETIDKIPVVYAIDRTNDRDKADDEILVAYAEIKRPPMPDEVPGA